MPKVLSLSETFRIAEGIERNGYQFYTQAAAGTKKKKVKQVMQELAEKEKLHEKTFSEWRQKYTGPADEPLYDPDGQAQAYLQAVSDTHVFNLSEDVGQRLASVQTPESMLRLAIHFEKDTIVFFTALKKTVKGEKQKKVDLLIQEEFSHIRQLQEVLKTL